MNQKELLLQHLRDNSHVTQLEAMALYRIFNLKARIEELRKEGVVIHTDMRKDATGKRYARYTLFGESSEVA